MTLRPVLAALVIAAPWIASGAEPSCRGRLSGKVQGSFACEAMLIDPGDGQVTFVVQALDAVPDVPAYAPGAFRVPLPVRAGTYTLDDLGMGKASVAAEGGTLFTATKTTGQRGEVLLVLRTVTPDAAGARRWTVHGTYRARLLPAGAGKEGEVVVEVSF